MSRPGLGRIAGVHSTVWIFAITAALTSRATLKRRVSSQSGWAAFRRSQIALCSLHEQQVQQRQAHPPVAHEAGVLDAAWKSRGQRAVVVQPQLAVDAAAQPVLGLLVAAVDLGAVPPVRDLVDERDRHLVLGGAASGPAGCGRRTSWPGRSGCAGRVVLGQRHLDRLGQDVLAVGDPVVVLELDPDRRQHVQERAPRLVSSLAREQLPAHLAGVRRHQARARLGADGGVGDVAREARAGGALHRVAEVVPRSRRPCGSAARRAAASAPGCWNPVRLRRG